MFSKIKVVSLAQGRLINSKGRRSLPSWAGASIDKLSFSRLSSDFISWHCEDDLSPSRSPSEDQLNRTSLPGVLLLRFFAFSSCGKFPSFTSSCPSSEREEVQLVLFLRQRLLLGTAARFRRTPGTGKAEAKREGDHRRRGVCRLHSRSFVGSQDSHGPPNCNCMEKDESQPPSVSQNSSH